MTRYITAQHCEIDGIKLDSRLEYRVYEILRRSIPSPVVIHREPNVRISPNRYWRVDFQILDLLIEVKGIRQLNFRRKLESFGLQNPHLKNRLIVVTDLELNLPYWVPTCRVADLESNIKYLI